LSQSKEQATNPSHSQLNTLHLQHRPLRSSYLILHQLHSHHEDRPVIIAAYSKNKIYNGLKILTKRCTFILQKLTVP